MNTSHIPIIIFLNYIVITQKLSDNTGSNPRGFKQISVLKVGSYNNNK